MSRLHYGDPPVTPFYCPRCNTEICGEKTVYPFTLLNKDGSVAHLLGGHGVIRGDRMNIHWDVCTSCDRDILFDTPIVYASLLPHIAAALNVNPNAVVPE